MPVADSFEPSHANPVALIGYMLALATFDLLGTVLAKEWTVHRAAWQLIGGAASFMALFLVLALGLRYAEMSIITLGWVVVLQTSVLLIDRSRYGTSISIGGWLAIAAILILQGYLMIAGTTALGPAETPTRTESVQSSAASAAS